MMMNNSSSDIIRAASMPYVIEQDGRGERSYDIFSRLLNDRIIFLSDEVNDLTSSLIVAQMLYLESVDPDKDISFYINSPGGSVGAQGQCSDIKIRADLLLRTRDTLNRILAERTGKPIETIEKDTERDNFMTAEQALEYGLIDRIIDRHV